MLLVLMMAVAVIAIVLLSATSDYRRTIQREREVEMIHRGAQYERAIRLYCRRYHAYPTSIEQLENTNNIRFLRKRYTDPMSADGQWQLAHLSDLKLAGATGLTPVVGGQGLVPASPTQLSSGEGTYNGGARGSIAGADTSATPDSPARYGGNAAFGADFGGPSPQAAGSNAEGPVGSSGSGPVLGGGPMLGVISKSKAEGIHSFNDKTHFNEWYFIYDPGQDRGQLPNGPYNPRLLLSSSTTAGQVGSSGSPVTGPTQTPLTAPPMPGPVGTIPVNQ